MAQAANPNDDDIQPLRIGKCIERYIDNRRGELSDATIRSVRSRWRWFEQFCDAYDVEYTTDLNRPLLSKYKQKRREMGRDPNPVTMVTQLNTVKNILQHLADWGFAEPNLHQAIHVPELRDKEDVKENAIDPEVALRVLEYLRRYEWASRQHVVFELIFTTTMRSGTVRALDIDDIHWEDNLIGAQHRPKSGTPLKNKQHGERLIAVPDRTTEMLKDWINNQRPTPNDPSSRRRPLIATQHGRASKTTIQSDVYGVMRPQYIGEECNCTREHAEKSWRSRLGDEEFERRRRSSNHEIDLSCAASNKNNASTCVDVEGPHALRKAAVKYHIDNGWDEKLHQLSDRANAEEEVLRKHYDQATEKERAERRRDTMDDMDFNSEQQD